jgi:hypothetical protein
MKISDLPYIALRCLILTIIVECLIAFILGYRKKDLLNILLANAITNPIVSTIPVYVNVKYGLLYRNICLLVLELLVLIVEGLIYNKYITRRKINPFVLSLILNMSSYLIGEVINYLVY